MKALRTTTKNHLIFSCRLLLHKMKNNLLDIFLVFEVLGLWDTLLNFLQSVTPTAHKPLSFSYLYFLLEQADHCRCKVSEVMQDLSISD